MSDIKKNAILNDAFSQGINLFLGSGFSILSQDRNGKTLPVGNGLKQELINKYRLNGLDELDLPGCCTVLIDKFNNDFREFLTERFDVHSWDELYKSLLNINIKNIFTTNIDNLVEKIFSHEDATRFINVVNIKGFSSDINAINLVYLHGGVSLSSSNYTFSIQEISSSFDTESKLWTSLSIEMEKFPTLFWGYSASDDGFLKSMSLPKYKSNKKWITIPGKNPGRELLYNAMLLDVLIADTNSILQSMKIHINPKILPASFNITTAFPEYSIPLPKQNISRPLEDFYLGDAPTWNDILFDLIPKMSHFESLKKSLLSSKNTIALGMPGTGKTTLLKQLAVDIFRSRSDKQHILVSEHESISLEKAKLLVRTIEGENTYVFLDNFTESLDATLYLGQQPNFKILAFDLESSFDQISHLINRQQYQIRNISHITNDDINTLFNSIPVNIRQKSQRIPSTAIDTPPSIFEFIDYNVTSEPFRRRFEKFLYHVLDTDPVAFEILIILAYVHSCRTPLSMDMLLAYFGEDISGYQEIYDKIQFLGNLAKSNHYSISEAIAIENQDIFSPRSTLFAKIIFEATKASDLRPVLRRFLENVSPLKIHSYDRFKTKAYDSDIALKAFPDYREGELFYDTLIYRDPENPYLRQHKALYLSKLQLFAKAFVEIDKASSIGYNHINIKNTKAIIMFHANLGVAKSDKDGNSRLQLDRALKMLEDCHTTDSRKRYHTIKYAEFAIDYYRLFRDAVAASYINQAKKWVDSEIASRGFFDKCLKKLQIAINDISSDSPSAIRA